MSARPPARARTGTVTTPSSAGASVSGASAQARPATASVTRGRSSTLAPDARSVGMATQMSRPATAATAASLDQDGALRKTVGDLQTRIQHLESERETLLYQMRENQNDADRERGVLERQLDDARNKKNAMKEKLDRVEKIEMFIINLFIEMRDRSHENPDGQPDVRAEREELRKLNIMVVLDKLRASLRYLQSFKEDYENELKGVLDRRKTTAEAESAQLRRQLEEAIAERDRALAMCDRAMGERADAVTNKERVTRECTDSLEDVQKDNERLADLVHAKEDEILRLKDELDQREQMLRHKNIRLMRISQLENQIQSNKIQHQFEVQKLQARQNKAIKELEKEIGKFSRTEAENEAYRSQLRQAEKQVWSFKNHIKRIDLQEFEKRVQHLETIIKHKDEEINFLQTELKHAQFVAEDVSEKNAKLKAEYDRIFKAVTKQRQDRAHAEAKEQKAINAHEFVDELPSHVEVYKQKLREKERSVKEMQEKVRRLLASEHRHMVRTKTGEIEKARYEEEIAALRQQILRLTSDQPKRPRTAAARINAKRAIDEEYVYRIERRNAELEDKLRDFDNLKTLTRTTAVAYEQLLEETTAAKQRLADDENDDGTGDGDGMGELGVSVDESDGNLDVMSFTVESSPDRGTSNRGPGSMSRALAAFRSSPTSHQERARPKSAMPSTHRMGSAHSTLKVGALLSS